VLSGARRDLPQAGKKTLFALALNKDDSPAADLTRDDWRLMEDGVERLVTDAKIATDPIDMTLVVDTSMGAQGSLGELRAALMSFTHRIFSGNPGATVSVIDVGNAAIRVADRVKTADDLDKTLKRTSTDRSIAAVVLEGMTDAARKLVESPSPRRAIVIVGIDGTSDASSSKEQQRVIEQVALSRASVWAVKYRTDATKHVGGMEGNGAFGAATGTSGDIGGMGSSQSRDPLLSLLPLATGGLRLTIGVPTALEVSLGQIANALLGQYAITFERPGDSSPKQLQMGVRPGIKISYPTQPPR
jgi:hypothetical protein